MSSLALPALKVQTHHAHLVHQDMFFMPMPLVLILALSPTQPVDKIVELVLKLIQLQTLFVSIVLLDLSYLMDSVSYVPMLAVFAH